MREQFAGLVLMILWAFHIVVIGILALIYLFYVRKKSRIKQWTALICLFVALFFIHYGFIVQDIMVRGFMNGRLVFCKDVIIEMQNYPIEGDDQLLLRLSELPDWQVVDISSSYSWNTPIQFKRFGTKVKPMRLHFVPYFESSPLYRLYKGFYTVEMSDDSKVGSEGIYLPMSQFKDPTYYSGAPTHVIKWSSDPSAQNSDALKKLESFCLKNNEAEKRHLPAAQPVDAPAPAASASAETENVEEDN